MRAPRNSARSLVRLAVVILATYTSPAFAYLDPGTGSLLLQGLIGAIAVGAFTVKLYWQKFKGFFTSKKNTEVSPSEPSLDSRPREQR